MKCLICYDIGESRIRNKEARYLESLAGRVEYSVFLCDLAPKKLAAVRGKLLMMTAKSENRRLSPTSCGRFFPMKDCSSRICTTPESERQSRPCSA